MSNLGQALLVPGRGKSGVSLPPVTSGLIAFYAARGIVGVATNATASSVPDSSGHGNPVTQANATKQATYLSAGDKNGGPTLQFNGTSDGHVSANLNPNNFSAASLSAWVKPTGTPSGTDLAQVIGLGASSAIVAVNASGFAASRIYDGANHVLLGAVSLVNTWHNITVTSDGVTQRLYVDGTQVNSGSAGNINWFSVLTATLGTSQTFTADTFFTGNISAVAIYNRVLSAGEVGRIGAWWP